MKLTRLEIEFYKNEFTKGGEAVPKLMGIVEVLVNVDKSNWLGQVFTKSNPRFLSADSVKIRQVG